MARISLARRSARSDKPRSDKRIHEADAATRRQLPPQTPGFDSTQDWSKPDFEQDWSGFEHDWSIHESTSQWITEALGHSRAEPSASVPAGAGAAASRGVLQTALEVSAPGDTLEREADQVAAHVLRMPAEVQRACATCKGETDQGREDLQRAARDGLRAPRSELPGFEQALEHARAGGEALPAPLRESMEGRFGADFSGVRLHRDAEASALAQSVRARAFTTGRDLFFREGEFRPDTDTGQHLIAHELTHSLQQQAGLNSVQRQILARSPETAAGAEGGSLVQRQADAEPNRSSALGPTPHVFVDKTTGRTIISVDGIEILEAQPSSTENFGAQVTVNFNPATSRVDILVVFTSDVAVATDMEGMKRLGAIYPNLHLNIRHMPEPLPIVALPLEGESPRRILDEGSIPLPQAPAARTTPGPAAPAAKPAEPEPAAEVRTDGPSAISEWVHGALDIAGFIPGVGEVADGVNAVIYLAEGRFAEAAISAAAMIPIVGDAAKVGKYGVKLGKEVLEETVEQGGKRVLKEGTERAEKELLEEGTTRLEKEVVEQEAQGVAKEFLEEAAEAKAEKELAEKAAARAEQQTAEETAEKGAKDKAAKKKKKKKDEESDCTPKRTCPHKGGNARSNACADAVPPNQFPGCDALVGGKNFDALGPARDLWEVKVHRFSSYPPAKKNFDLKAIVLAGVVAEAVADLVIATRCGFRFVLAVADAQMFAELKQLVPPGVILRHVPEC